MKSKRLYTVIVSLLLSLAVLFSVVACSGDSGGGAPTVDSIDMLSAWSLDVGDEYTLQAALSPFGSTAKISWRSSDPDIVSVSEGGVIKGLRVGASIIRATAGGKHADCMVTVIDPSQREVRVTDVSLNTGKLNLEVGETSKLTPTVKPDNATNKTLTWVSSKPSVATVSRTGEVAAVASGKTIITATSNNGIKANCVVEVAGEIEDETPELYVRKIDELESRNDFIMGMDASAVPSLNAAGVVYRDFDGNVKDVFEILKENGITDIRIRIWNYPYQIGHYGEMEYGYGGGNCDLENAVAIAERCKKYDLGVIVDFHYSDFWADPGKQSAPKEWANKTVDERKTAIYEYTKQSLIKIKKTGVKISMVQVGNETTSAICEASFSKTPEVYCAYIDEGAKAVREVTGAVANGGAKVVIHLTNPETGYFGTFAKTFNDYQVDYDVFGTSYYPNIHGSLQNLSDQLKNVHTLYGKDVMVMETSYAFTREDFDGTGGSMSGGSKPYTVQGQANSVLDIIETIAKLGNYGLGVCYWEGTWIAPADNFKDTMDKCNAYGCGWASAMAGPASIGGDGYQEEDVLAAGGVGMDNQAFFRSSDGAALESLKLFKLAKVGQLVAPAADEIRVSEVYCTVDVGEVTLPKTISITLNDDSIMQVEALWDVDKSEVAEYIHTVNTYIVTGTTIFGGEAVCNIYVQNVNLLDDGGFENTKGNPQTDNLVSAPPPWQVNRLAKEVQLQLYVSNENAEMGQNSFHFWDSTALEFELYQQVNLEKALSDYGFGTYSFSIDFSGGDCGDTQDIYSYAVITHKDGSETLVRGTNVEAIGWLKWNRSSVAEIEIDETVASVKVGLHVKSEAGGWGNMDNAQFFFSSATSD